MPTKVIFNVENVVLSVRWSIVYEPRWFYLSVRSYRML